MRFTSLAFFSGLCTVVSAHFQLQYPPPRGPFVEDDEPTFCDGYTNSVSNRTQFPLNGGFITINSEHPSWTFGVLLSNQSNPQSFQAFSQAVPYFTGTGEGTFCLPLDLASVGISGVDVGANVTLQFVFDGGDAQLYQCADLILSSSASVPSGVSCQNSAGVSASLSATSTPSASTKPSSTASGSSSAPSSTATTPSGSSSTPAPSQTGTSDASRALVSLTSLMGVVGAALAML